MNRKVFCKCSQCGALTTIKSLEDSYIICDICHRILDITGDLYVNGIKLSNELETQLVNSLNLEHDVKEVTKHLKQVLMEGDKVNETI